MQQPEAPPAVGTDFHLYEEMDSNWRRLEHDSSGSLFGSIVSSLFMMSISFGFYSLSKMVNTTPPSLTSKSNKKKQSSTTAQSSETSNNSNSIELVDQRFQFSKKPTKEEKILAKELYKNRKPKSIDQVLPKHKLDLISNRQDSLNYGKELATHLSERRFMNQKKWICMSRPQYKYSCGVSSLTSVWNYLFSSLGEGSLPPLTQEEVLQILGFSEPFEKIRFGPFTGNQSIMKWFRELLKAFNCQGSCSIFWKCKGEDVIIPHNGDSKNIKEDLKNGLKSQKTAFIYHCHNHYMVLIGYEESSDTPSKVYDVAMNELTNTWFLIGDNSRLQEPVESVKFTDIEKDLNQEGPFFFNIRHPEKGIQKKEGKSLGNVNCVLKFTSEGVDIKQVVQVRPEKRTKFDKTRKHQKSFEIVGV